MLWAKKRIDTLPGCLVERLVTTNRLRELNPK